MNEKKFSFILCTNDQHYMNECMIYLEELFIPDGYEIEVLGITEARSMTAGYNEGMQQSDAKYKIYMHQDVFLTNKQFLFDILRIFQEDDQIGMIGLVGTPYMNGTGTMWAGIRYGGFYRLQEEGRDGTVRKFRSLRDGYLEVEAVDGLLIATQYDLPWRDDLFCKWDFYDVSQSFEFQKAGYQVVVPGQEKLWYIHDCGTINLENYDKERRRFLNEYAQYMRPRASETWDEYLDKVREKIEAGYHGSQEEKERLHNCVEQTRKSEN